MGVPVLLIKTIIRVQCVILNINIRVYLPTYLRIARNLTKRFLCSWDPDNHSWEEPENLRGRLLRIQFKFQKISRYFAKNG